MKVPAIRAVGAALAATRGRGQAPLPYMPKVTSADHDATGPLGQRGLLWSLLRVEVSCTLWDHDWTAINRTYVISLMLPTIRVIYGRR